MLIVLAMVIDHGGGKRAVNTKVIDSSWVEGWLIDITIAINQG